MFTPEIVNYNDFGRMINDYIAVFKSARKPLTAILHYWWKWNEVNIFGLKGPGKYEDLSEDYKDFKESAVGFIYPILKFDGTLQASLTGAQSPYSVAVIYDDELVMGTSAETSDGEPYALYLQRGTKNMPARPPIIKTDEQMNNFAKIFFQTALRDFKNVKEAH
ncbi:MAG: hypothetical protein BWY84_00018 [Candidatus Aerophobetes bacterium ADurb.Bin490]|nr:MAG: hypothetical protein BWY84_00018 [Candidatus Aerophobetes bacterium ADurb.Bin490]